MLSASDIGGPGRSSALSWAVNISVLLLVVLWLLPVFGILVTSFRDRDQIAATGWWTATSATEQNIVYRTPAPDGDAQVFEDGLWRISGNLLVEGAGLEPGATEIVAFGVSSRAPTAFAPGDAAELRSGATARVAADGAYEITSETEMTGRRGARLFFTTIVPPRLTTENYEEVMSSGGVGRSFVNSLTVAIPATVIPILVAAYAAYALAWMPFPGRALLLAAVVALLVVPFQLSLIPLLRLYNDVGAFFGVPAKTYLGIWLAHTGFGLPLAIYILRNYIAGLPREIMESARVDGASDFDIFVKIVLPLSFPALASFAIFQFLWTWNDLLVAIVFLGAEDEQLVLTARLRELLGSRGGDWEIMATSAFITIIVPLIVFFTLQRYLVRGLLAGSVK